MRNIFVLVFTIVILQFDLACAQSFSDIYITKHYKNIPLREVLGDLQKSYSLKFFFSDQQVDSVKINADINNQVLEKALKIILRKTKLIFFFDKDRIVLLVDEKKVVQSSLGNTFTIRGKIDDAHTNEAIPYATIYIQNVRLGVTSDENGYYILKDIPQGIYLIQYSFIGYGMQERKIVLESNLEVDIALTEHATELKAVEITSSLYEIGFDEPSSYALSRKEIFHSPNLAKDISRTLRVLPGIASNDFSAKPRIRGGSTDESVFYLDNFEIISPFHFEEFDGVFSIFNTDYINNVKVIPGGFSSSYTDKISGVIDMQTPALVESNKASFSIDLLNSTIFLKQKINDKLDVQLSGRRTYLDLVLGGLNDNKDMQIKPVYYDFWSKVNFRINERNRLAFNFLHSTDNGNARIRESSYNWIDMNGDRNDNYFWINWKNNKSTTYQQITTLGYQRLAKWSNFNFNNTLSENNVDNRIHDVILLSHTSFWKIGTRNNVEFGGDLKHFTSHTIFNEIRYNTFESNRDQTVIDSIDVDSKFYTLLAGVFLQNTITLSDNIHVVAGIRLSYFNAEKNSVLLAPRIGIGIDLLERLTFKAGYGMYNQAAYPMETQSYDGQSRITQDYKQSVHYTASLSHSSPKTSVTLNGYYKDNKKLYDDYRYDVFNRLGGGIAILDRSFITASGYSKGIEAVVRHQYGKKSSVTASYAYAINKIKNLSGVEAYRDNDRRHTFIINNLLSLANNWTFSAYSIFYTGEPYTPSTVNFIGENDERQILFFDLGSKNSERLPSFYSLDMRVDKTWYFKKWELNIYLNLINVTSHKNVRNYFWYPSTAKDSSYNASQVEETYLSKIFVSPGITLSF